MAVRFKNAKSRRGLGPATHTAVALRGANRVETLRLVRADLNLPYRERSSDPRSAGPSLKVSRLETK